MIVLIALNRLATEIAVLENITIATATEKLVELLREKLAAA